MTDPPDSAPELRKFPYPFRNMLAILSDVDLMSKAAFEGMHRFMNTDAECGALGRGVGLDVGDTFWMGNVSVADNGTMPRDSDHRSWRYWWPDSGREIYAGDMRRYLAAGWIDVPHTFFDYRKDPRGYSRSRAAAAVEEWRRIAFSPLAWIDHARNPWNIATFRRGALVRAAHRGDRQVIVAARQPRNAAGVAGGDTIVVGRQRIAVSEVAASRCGGLKLALAEPLDRSVDVHTPLSFHPQRKPVEGAVASSHYRSVDLALRAGIRAFWTRLPGEVDEATDGGRLGLSTTLVPQMLPDGTRIWGLMRYYETGQTNNTWLGACLSRVLFGDAVTDGRAMRPDTYQIVSTHLGYGDADRVCDDLYTIGEDVQALNGGEWFNQQTADALRALAAEQKAGRVLVANTTRLVRYNLTHEALTANAGTRRGFEVSQFQGRVRITIHTIYDAIFGPDKPSLRDLRGITFYCDDPGSAEIWIGEHKVDREDIQVNPPDHTGRASAGIRWYPSDTTDYTGVR